MYAVPGPAGWLGDTARWSAWHVYEWATKLIYGVVFARVEELMQRPAAPGFVQVVDSVVTGFDIGRRREAGIVIGRTMFETDRLPREWVKTCNQMDYTGCQSSSTAAPSPRPVSSLGS
jgi:hypothetical protein